MKHSKTKSNQQSMKSIHLFAIMVVIVSIASVLLVQGVTIVSPMGGTLLATGPTVTVVAAPPGLQTQEYRTDASTVLLCSFNVNGTCKTSTGTTTSAAVNPLKNTFQYLGRGGMFASGSADITPTKGVGIYPTSYTGLSFKTTAGTIEGWVKLNASGNTAEQYVATVKGLTSLNGD
ncbi:MAG: hypothetical protein AABX02_02610, partial [archaeon]